MLASRLKQAVCAGSYPVSLLCLALLLLNSHVLSAQGVDPLTGRAQISIPLGGISAYDLGTSLSLSHKGDALQVNEGQGNAGMGWSANLGGGYIYREVRGLPDAFQYDSALIRYGWLRAPNAGTIQTYTPYANNNLSHCWIDSSAYSFIRILMGQNHGGGGFIQDTEPDIYYFGAPGISGKFVYGADGSIKMIPYQDLKVTAIDSTGFTITTNTGTVYTFGSPTLTTRQTVITNDNLDFSFYNNGSSNYIWPITFASIWNLISVVSSTTGASLQYSYISGEQQSSASYFAGIKPTYTNKADTMYYMSDLATPSLLSKITLNKYAVNIRWANSVVDRITINESETNDSTAYDFVYRSIKSTKDSAFSVIYKPFLMEVKQFRYCNPLPSYRFTYQGIDTVYGTTSIPWRRGWGEDFFGYYNGQDNNKNIPTVYFYASDSGARRYRVTPIPGGTPTTTLTGGNRSVNGTYSSFGAITRVDFPTGGFITYSYEPNKYYDASTSEELYGAGVRVASVTTSGGEVASGKSSKRSGWHAITTTYQYGTTNANTVTSGKITYPPVFTLSNDSVHYRTQTEMGGGTQVLYGRVREMTAGQGYRVYQFDLPHVYPDVAPAASVGKVARPYSASCSVGLLRNGSYTWPFAPVTDYGFERGYLTSVSEFNKGDTLTQQRRITYTIPQSYASVKGMRVGSISSSHGHSSYYYFSIYEIPVNQSRIEAQETVVQVGDQLPGDSTKVTTAYKYNSGNQVTRTVRTNDDGSVEKTFVKYARDYPITAPAGGDIQANAIYNMKNNNRNGEVIETYSTFMPVGGTGSDSVTRGAALKVYQVNSPYVWPYQSKHFPQGFSFTPSSATSTSFTSSSKYITDATYDYANALPVGQVGISLIPSGAHYSTYGGLPLATFANCKGANAVYEGFEMKSANGLTVSGGTAKYRAGWTGNKSIRLTDTLTLTLALTSTSSVVKSGNSYRVSAWLYATANVTVTVAVTTGTTPLPSATLAYTTPNQWTYVEVLMDVTNASSSFTLQVTSSGTVLIDEFTALPKSARISTTTVSPLTGVTSKTDDRGNSAVITYDPLGRTQNTFDRKRNLVGVQEYASQRPGVVKLDANFTSNVTEYSLGQSVTFTAASTLAPNSCASGITYLWTFRDAAGSYHTATGASTTRTLASLGEASVKLKVTAPGYDSASYTDNFCVDFNGTAGLSVSPGTSYDPCASGGDDGHRTFTATVGGRPPLGWTLSYQWWFTTSDGVWAQFDPSNIHASSSSNGTDIIPLVLGSLWSPTSNANQAILQCPTFAYEVLCIVTATQASSGVKLSQNQCLPKQVGGSATAWVVYAPTSPCH